MISTIPWAICAREVNLEKTIFNESVSYRHVVRETRDFCSVQTAQVIFVGDMDAVIGETSKRIQQGIGWSLFHTHLIVPVPSSALNYIL